LVQPFCNCYGACVQAALTRCQGEGGGGPKAEGGESLILLAVWLMKPKDRGWKRAALDFAWDLRSWLRMALMLYRLCDEMRI